MLGKTCIKKLKNYFFLVYIETMVTNIDELNNYNFEAIITTYPINYKENIPILQRSIFKQDSSRYIRESLFKCNNKKNKNASFATHEFCK